MTHTYDRRIDVQELARVEGEGAMHVHVDAGRVSNVQLEIYEPPRFFEGLLRGRAHTEPPDLTARICGICPVAYQMSACQAVEDACGVRVEGPIRDLRRLLYCAEWIESHALHIYLLHAPDFLGYESAIEMAADHRELVERGLMLRKLGNRLLETVGGRAIHPVNVRLGGFHRAPRKAELLALVDDLERALEAAVATVAWVADFNVPDMTQDHVYVALRDDEGYPLDRGRVVSTAGLDAPVSAWPSLFAEDHVAHSTALHGRMRDGSRYMVGPAARFVCNADRLSPVAAEAAVGAGLDAEAARNPFRSIVVRAVELTYAIDEALRLVRSYEEPDRPAVDVPARPGTGHGATEAPRGILYHRYSIDGRGLIADASIVPPTAQNQPAIEADLASFVQDHLHLADPELQWRCEQAIRNYDPCISCSTHFLHLEVERT